VAGAAVVLAFFMTGAVPAQETDLEQRALALVNEARAEAGLDALSYSASLAEAAQQHAEDMLERDYYAHETPGGETFADRIREAGDERWLLTAENIARCAGCQTPPGVARVEAFHEGWMDSAGHRRNILEEDATSFGFGIVGEGEAVYAVQTFAGR
jgi:uncharacterized protein YkwD